MDISRRSLGSDVALLSLKGRLDGTSSPAVRDALQKSLEENFNRIIIDLQHVPFIDSSGLAALVSGLRMAREKKGDIILSAAQPQAQIVFRLTMLDRIFTIHPTAEEAKHSLRHYTLPSCLLPFSLLMMLSIFAA